MVDMVKRAVESVNDFSQAVAGALFGPESHSRIRYSQQTAIEQENAALRLEIRRLQQENAILKKHLSGC